MLLHSLKTAIRNLLHHRGNSFINISGLAIGMGCCLMITLYVLDELSYDRYHENFDRIYRVVHHYRQSENDGKDARPAASDFQVWGNSAVGPALQQDFPEILKVCQFMGRTSVLLRHGDTRFQEDNFLFMDSTAFELFSWTMVEGDPKTALTEPYSIVLTETLAKKYFGDADPVGQTIIVDDTENYKVTGVMKDVPHNSHFTFDGLLSMSTYHIYRKDIFSAWGYVDFYTYFLVRDNFDLTAMQTKVDAFIKRHGQDKFGYTIAFEPLKDVYLKSQAKRQPGVTGSLTNIYIFSTVALFILAIACINFMNLSTARAMDRAKEVGVRKASGANRVTLVRQFLTEAVLLSLLSGILAMCLAAAFIPAFQSISRKIIPLSELSKPILLLALAGGSVLVGLMAGLYPALVLSGFEPAAIIKGLSKTSGHGAVLRKSLVVFQFCLSVALIACTIIVFNQLDYLRKRDPGFAREQMLIIDFAGDQQTQNLIDNIKRAVARVPGVSSVSAQRTVPGGFFPKATTELESGQGQMIVFEPDLYEIDYDFVPNFGLEMIAGRNYSKQFGTDTTSALVLNESAVKNAGYTNPNDVIGKRFSQWGRNGIVIGVVKDFNYRSLRNRIDPLSLRLSPRTSANSLAVKLSASNLQASLGQIEIVWKQMVPHRPFTYSFLDDNFNRQYIEDVHFGKLFTTFAGLAIFIACFGLFGLSTYNARQRTKEIGIRKVLGASVMSIVALLSRDFIKLVFIAIALATPAAWFAMMIWLDGFAYKIPIGMGVFLLSGSLVTFMALLVTASQSISTALSNPLRSLKHD